MRGHSLILLEMELQAIAGACTAILEMLNDPFRLPQYLLNDRLIGWLSDTEPKTCLTTFNEMQDFLKVDEGVQRFNTTEFPYPENEAMVAAITLFHSRKGHFQFLLTGGHLVSISASRDHLPTIVYLGTTRREPSSKTC